ncbi:MAG: integration host factor subunit beta [Candidatus Marinimicrobia bacterium]|nr:integration host factor subunit beta [Candidatus Neomarinimicrobiota bacterium]
MIKRASYKLNVSNNDSKIITDCFFEILREMFTEKSDIINLEVRNFGVFNIFKTKGRFNALNPRTKEKVIIPERKKIVFKPGKQIKDRLYNKYAK